MILNGFLKSPPDKALGRAYVQWTKEFNRDIFKINGPPGVSQTLIYQHFHEKKVILIAGRKRKLTNNSKDRKYQRDATEELKEHDASMSSLNPSPPDELVGYAKDIYVYIAKSLNEAGLIKQIDQSVVIELCRQMQLAHEAYFEIFGGDEPQGIQFKLEKQLQDHMGNVVGTQFLGYQKNPAVTTLNAATTKIKSYCETLGMTPAARASLLAMAQDTKHDDDYNDIDDYTDDQLKDEAGY